MVCPQKLHGPTGSAILQGDGNPLAKFQGDGKPLAKFQGDGNPLAKSQGVGNLVAKFQECWQALANSNGGSNPRAKYEVKSDWLEGGKYNLKKLFQVANLL